MHTPEAPEALEVAHEPAPAVRYPWYVRLAAHFPMTVTVYAYQLNRRGRASRLARGLIVMLNVIVYTCVAWLAVLPIMAATRPGATEIVAFTPHSVTVFTPQVRAGAVVAETAVFILTFMAAAWAFRFGWQRIRPSGCIPLATCGDLADYMATQPRDRRVVVRRGNDGHSPLAEATEGMFAAQTPWYGTAWQLPEVPDVLPVPDDAEHVVVISPVY